MGNTFMTGNYVNGIFQDASNNIGIGAAPSGTYKFDVTGTGRFTGNVGVGATLSSWNVLFSAIDISTTASFTGASSGSANMFNNAYYNGTNYIYKTSDYAFRYLQGGGIHAWYVAPSGTAGNAITFTEAMRILSTGELQFASTGGFQSNNNTIYNQSTVLVIHGGTGGLQLYDDANRSNAVIISKSSNQISFNTNGTGEKMRIGSDSLVTITQAGTTPSYGFRLVNTSGNYWGTLCGGDNFYYLYYNGTTKGKTDPSTGVYTALSDKNKKKDFELSSIGLQSILGLKPTLYRMSDESEEVDKHLGFIAQEVKDFIPQAYAESGVGEEKFIGLNFNSIVAVLVKAIQEQQATITSLQDRLTKGGL
jgi:hypothetical protein